MRFFFCLPMLLLCFDSTAAEPPQDVTPEMRQRFEQAAMTQAGHAKKGRALFLDEKRTRCAICHQVNGKGGKVGPDLSRIGGKFDRPHLIESLLHPSQQIVEGYRSSNILTTSGKLLAGIIKEEDDQSLVIEDANGDRLTVSRDEIEAIKASPVSLMPDGLAASLSSDEFCDLVAYLETLRSGIQDKFGSGTRGPMSIPDGYRITTVATSLTGATA